MGDGETEMRKLKGIQKSEINVNVKDCNGVSPMREIERDREGKKTDDEKSPSMLEEISITFSMAH